MQRYTSISLMMMLLGLAMLCAGCGGPSTEPVGEMGEASTGMGVTAPGGITPPGQITNIAVPDWFINIPEDPNFMYAVSTNSNKNLEMGLDTAKHQARTDLTTQMESKISGMFKRFREDIGVGEDAELTAMATAVTKEVYSQVLSGAKPKRQEIQKEGNLFNIYILYELSLADMNSAVVDKVKANKNMYTRFRASQGFKELEEEVGKYEDWKKEQEQTQ